VSESRFLGALIHPQHSRVQLLPGSEGWTLPSVQRTGRGWIRPFHELVAEFSGILGTPVLVLHCMDFRRDEDATRTIYALEPREELEGTLGDGKWVDLEALAGLRLAEDSLRPHLRRLLLDRAEDRVPAARPRWARPGWFADAVAWMTEALSESGHRLTGPVEQFSSWCISCLLRVPTDRGMVYLKACPRSAHAAEPGVVQGLSALLPGRIPAPLAVNEREQWLLLPDFGEPIGRGTPKIEDLEGFLREHARLQLEVAANADRLLAWGCLDRRLEAMPARIGELFADDEAVGGLSPAERRDLRAHLPALQAGCQSLASFRIPETLVHGDLHLGNVAQPDGRSLVFDWGQAAWAHPFFDLAWMFLDNEAPTFARLLDAYLEPWRGLEPEDRLREAWAEALPLVLLHQALHYRELFAGLEPASQAGFGDPVARFLRPLLAHLGAS
jgi:hypothetical protein